MQTTERAVLLSKLADLRPDQFEQLALEVFRYQAAENPLYARYLQLLQRPSGPVQTLSGIPFLPVSLFKRHTIRTGSWQPRLLFSSSSTSGQTPSRHLVRDPNFYLQNSRRGFSQFYGDPSEWCILALLPAYLERPGSSLVAMTDFFIRLSKYQQSGFFLNNLDELAGRLDTCRSGRIPTLLLGVSYALLDLAERFPMDLSGLTIMETGGMKGRRREITRQELHSALCQAFQVPGIHSEYGMTELFSQAYRIPGLSTDHIAPFRPARTMRAYTREIHDPFCPLDSGRTGVLHFIDLANLDTCSFIASEDVGKAYADGAFDVLGRLDAAEMRGCNLMVE
ncbi:MAG: acyl transferase [Saprospirales bacterium]|nr:acyl transferase [Saprospirales bacterium]MBK8921358.1 acyl transferase [Saprospirales bacterium]